MPPVRAIRRPSGHLRRRAGHARQRHTGGQHDRQFQRSAPIQHGLGSQGAILRSEDRRSSAVACRTSRRSPVYRRPQTTRYRCSSRRAMRDIKAQNRFR
ncbi:hypothetical protein MYVA_5723 [Mycolicibacterium vaccae 95051]|nr:hypothetical protein MYVA_5723 [Mycolicibacterium vaccae 95051]